MATIGATDSLAATLGARIRDARHALREEQRRRRLYTRTQAELASLSDRDLADIGISRLQIRDIAREAAYGDR